MSIFLRVIVLQFNGPIEECIDNPVVRIDSPTKPILVVFTPTNRWSYLIMRLSTGFSRPVYCKSHFMKDY